MMGYTHAVIGAGGALMISVACGEATPEQYLIATIAGTLGGVVVDIDTKDNHRNPKILDLILKSGVLNEIIGRQYLALAGGVSLLVVLVIGYLSQHRTFSHSLLFILLSSIAVSFIYPKAVPYFFSGGILHLLYDMLNNPFENHGIWLLYPIKTGKGIALGVCKAARIGNKVFYFIGLIIFSILSILYIWEIGDFTKSVAVVLIFLYMVVSLHFVRLKSEKEQRHIMHMRGEL